MAPIRLPSVSLLGCQTLDTLDADPRCGTLMGMVDRQQILETLYARQALRREARLPLLDLTAEYHRAVVAARWREIVEEHWDRVEAEILAEKRREKPDWGWSAGGRMALTALTVKTLTERYYAAPRARNFMNSQTLA
jgi:hypothetical protein